MTRTTIATLAVLIATGTACQPAADQKSAAAPAAPAAPAAGLGSVQDAQSNTVVTIAAGSPDHTTLVAAAGLVDVLGMADGSSATISKKGDDLYIGEAKIVGSARGSNGIVHIIDAVVLPAK